MHRTVRIPLTDDPSHVLNAVMDDAVYELALVTLTVCPRVVDDLEEFRADLRDSFDIVDTVHPIPFMGLSGRNPRPRMIYLAILMPAFTATHITRHSWANL